MTIFSTAGHEVQPADFSQETWWLTLIKAVFIIVFLLITVIMALWVERRGLARMQTRPGPNVHGPFGLLQAVADAVKLLVKEDFNKEGVDRILYLVGPLIAAFTAFMVLAVVPFGPNVNILGHSTPLQLMDPSIGGLYVLAIASLGVYGIILGGWSSKGTLPLLGAMRSSAQVISYELGMGMAMVSVFIVSGSMRTSQIVAAQSPVWWCFALIPAACIYFISAIAEINRLPFDLPECEGELVAGHETEYSSMKFAWYYLAEYINMFNVSCVFTTLFLGGWRFPFGEYILGGVLNTGFFPMLWFIIKMWAVAFCIIWVRGTLVRVRYDQLMNLGWKVLLPISLGWVVIVALMRGISLYAHVTLVQMLIGIAVVFLVALVVIGLTGRQKQHDTGPDEPFDPMAGGYPLPPLPGQQMPVSPRAGRAEVTLAGAGKEGEPSE
ncbi:NADH-quinone oxidoreductase subunit H [Actinomyces sp. HMSC06A08]|nr:NADH:ubiquinone oxidoreductase subunit H [Actinomyces sp. HMSC064C12]OFK02638.1 NADH:ubiquinone oxidoreductase subunit H [Actinomyces sp. HMSC072A03]OFT54080.1 NADH-quinone oxidoreductase subunit H [Actinomyces sp. HMSC06A08]